MTTPTPKKVMWFGNGMAAVFDENGDQIPEFQGRHEETYRKLEEVGIFWGDVTTFGMPNCVRQP